MTHDRDAAAVAVGTQAELGWTFRPDVAGNGYATEAVEAALSLCFVTRGLRRVNADAFEANESSWRLMERVGMRRESRSVQASLHRDLSWQNGVSYALLAADWLSRSPQNGRGDHFGVLSPMRAV